MPSEIVSCPLESIKQAANRVLSITDESNPAFGHFTIVTGNDCAVLNAFGPGMECCTTIADATTHSDAKITLPAHKLAGLVKLSAGKTFKVRSETDKGSERITCITGKSRFSFPCVAEPLSVAAEPTTTLGIVECGNMHRIIHQAMSRSSAKAFHELQGVELSWNGSQLLAAATDKSHAVFAFCPFEPAEGSRNKWTVWIPHAAASALDSVLGFDRKGQLDQQCVLAKTDTGLLVSTNNFTLNLRLLNDGKGSSLEKLIPKDDLFQVRINAQTMFSALKSAKALCGSSVSNKVNYITMEFDNKGVMTLRLDAMTDDFLCEIDVPYTGRPFTAGFKLDYMLLALSHIASSAAEETEAVFSFNVKAPGDTPLLISDTGNTVRSVIACFKI